MSSQSKIFEKLFNEYSDKVYSLARFKGICDTDAQDVVQETFIAVIASYHSYEGKANIKTYILSIARHKIADYYRKKSIRCEQELSESLKSEAISNDNIETLNIKNAVDKLKKEDKELIYLIFTLGLNYQETAVIVNIPEGTIKSRMFKIRKLIKNNLGGSYR